MHCLRHLPFLPQCHHSLHFWAEPVLRFCRRKNIKDNKKNMAILLVWDKASYTERFLALLSCTCVLHPTLVHLCQTSLLLPIPLPLVASAPLQWAHQPHCPIPSMHVLPLMWPVPNNIAAFVLGL
jgi:hypothetical protein